jgi:hypothetical protein
MVLILPFAMKPGDIDQEVVASDDIEIGLVLSFAAKIGKIDSDMR